MDCVLCLSLKLPHFRTQSQEFCHLMVNQRSTVLKNTLLIDAIKYSAKQYNGMPIQYNFTRQCNAIQLQCNAAQYNNLYLNSASCENIK